MVSASIDCGINLPDCRADADRRSAKWDDCSVVRQSGWRATTVRGTGRISVSETTWHYGPFPYGGTQKDGSALLGTDSAVRTVP